MIYATFADAIQHGCDYLGSGLSDAVQRDVRRAVLEAYRDLANAHNWSYLYHHGRFQTVGPFGTENGGSSIAYSATTNQVTLTGAVWPTWAAYGYLWVGTLKSKVAARNSDTLLTLDTEVNFGQDLPAGTAYKLYQDTYVLPSDFIAQDQALYEQNFGGMTYVHPRHWLYDNRYVWNQGIPSQYSITGDPQYPERLVIRIAPIPFEARTIDFIYKRRPRSLLIVTIDTGAVTVADLDTIVTASSPVFTAGMAGSVLRIGGQLSATATPTDLIGDNPPIFETLIKSYLSATQVETMDLAPQALTAQRYTVSDPIDIEPGAMLNAFYRCIEKHLSINRTLKDKPSAAAQYLAALNEARSADSRSFAGRFEGSPFGLRQRFRDMPVGPDQS